MRNDIVAAIEGLVGSAAGAGVYRSTDSGGTWTPVITQALKGIAIGRTSLAAQSPYVYAMVGDGSGVAYSGFFVSTDSGNTWTAKTLPCAQNGSQVIDGSTTFAGSCGAVSTYGQSSFDQALAIAPGTPTTVYFGGVGIYESNDSGNTWNFIGDNGGTHEDQHALQFDAFTSTTLYLGNDGGLYSYSTTNNTNNTYVALNGGLNAGQIYVVGQDTVAQADGLAGFQDNGTQLDTGSKSWAWEQAGDGGFTMFDHNSPSNVYHAFPQPLGTRFPVLAESSDGGVTYLQRRYRISSRTQSERSSSEHTGVEHTGSRRRWDSAMC